MKKYILKLACILICGVNITSCVNTDQQILHQTLEQAGNRKSELEKALSYYAQEKDSLKQKAMVFLIKDMYAHYAQKSLQKDIKNRTFDIMDTLSTQQTNPGMTRYPDYELFSLIMDSISRNTRMQGQEGTNIKYDSRTVTANFLIQNLEFAYRAWKNNPWTKGIDFDTFCEYILPYRLDNEEIEHWRPQFYNEYSKRAGKYLNITDINRVSSRQAISLRTQIGIESIYPYTMNMSSVDLMQMGRCYDIGRYRAMILRSIGIPATIDYVPHWGNYTGKHGIVKVVTIKQEELLENDNSTKNTSVQFGSASFLQGKELDIKTGDLPKGVEVQYSKTIPKVYRHTWSVQPDRRHLVEIANEDEIAPEFSLCIKDVTDEYLTCSDAFIEMHTSKNKIGYLCVSERGEWIPVACSEIDKNKKALFKNMGRNVMYLPAIYEKGRIIAAGEPFYLDEKGNINRISANTQKKEDIRLLAKYTYYSYTATHAVKLKGGYFEASNQKDFKKSDSLTAIKGIPYYRQQMTINTPKKYRYIRFVAPEEKDCCLAELTFTGIVGRDTTLLKSVKFYDEMKNEIKPEILQDGKYNRYYTMSTKKLIADLGSLQQLTGIELVPRSNTNGIIPGQQYELYYWTGNDGWESLGKQTATNWYLEYKQIPSKALLWLKCYDNGKEERIFTYEDGKQKWW